MKVSTKILGGLGIVGLIVVFVIGAVAISGIGFHNREVNLRNAVIAQGDANTAVFDRTWKVIAQQAEVAEQHKEAFAEVYTDIMDASGGGNNRLLAFIQSVNPQYDQATFVNLQNSIEANRRDFEREQKSLISKQNAHRVFVSQFPNNIWADLLGRDALDVTIVTSTRTQEVFSAGVDNDITVFENN